MVMISSKKKMDMEDQEFSSTSNQMQINTPLTSF